MENQSLYLQNLPEKWAKWDLGRELYMLFSTYGPVLDVTCLKTKKMRGQAHILFRDVNCAARAMRACQGFVIGGRKMKISYSTNMSNTLRILEGDCSKPETKKAVEQKADARAPSVQAGTKRSREESDEEEQDEEMEMSDEDD
ncbi:hypothetical protein K470DRAFT_215823 [Piedraia hortae CBS 480.64]|uniref:RRM domain-containing protein n=1 Tax=Piedraia hortae CBS 480.64 TaxID=1314780 RepID=A0A6A7C124_9PEZI|nr:hypothetical protein K470DRAFT_215823 [Piedraia hortae CBS 480.64]